MFESVCASSPSRQGLVIMPSSPLQHLLKLLQVVSDQERSDALQSNKITRNPHSFGDGVQFLEEFKKRLAGPIARSTPQSSPEKNYGEREYYRCPFQRFSFSMPDLHKLSPIYVHEGNATGLRRETSQQKARKRVEFS